MSCCMINTVLCLPVWRARATGNMNLQLSVDDTLFVYTDGMSEATDAQNTLFGTERMPEILSQHMDVPFPKKRTEKRAKKQREIAGRE